MCVHMVFFKNEPVDERERKGGWYVGLLCSGINHIVCRGQEIVDGVADWYLLGMSLC